MTVTAGALTQGPEIQKDHSASHRTASRDHRSLWQVLSQFPRQLGLSLPAWPAASRPHPAGPAVTVGRKLKEGNQARWIGEVSFHGEISEKCLRGGSQRRGLGSRWVAWPRLVPKKGLRLGARKVQILPQSLWPMVLLELYHPAFRHCHLLLYLRPPTERSLSFGLRVKLLIFPMSIQSRPLGPGRYLQGLSRDQSHEIHCQEPCSPTSGKHIHHGGYRGTLAQSAQCTLAFCRKLCGAVVRALGWRRTHTRVPVTSGLNFH